MKAFAWVAAALAATAIGAKEISLPPETVFLAESGLPGYALASGYCVTCHSADYVRYQPPGKPAAFWKAEVMKMRTVYAAPIPEDKVDPIVDYLAKVYGAEAATSRTTKE